MRTLSRHLDFALLLAVSVVVWWHPLATTLRLAANRDEYTHIQLIVPLCLWLIYINRRTVLPVCERNPRSGSLGLGVALLIAFLVRSGAGWLSQDVQLSLDMLALVTWWLASVLFCFGIRTFRALLFPLCLLFLMLPLPEFALNGVISWLQQGSASAARLLFMAAGIPVAQNGIELSIPGLSVEVAPECSSIRSSSMLLVATMVLGHVFLRSPWRRAAVIAAAIPLSVAKNGLRIFVLSSLGAQVDPAFLEGRLHHQGGIAFFALALAALITLIWVLKRTENSPPRRLLVTGH